MLSLCEYSKIVGIPEEEIKGRSRKDNVSIARQVYWLYLNSIGYGYRRISKMDISDGRTPETILSGIKTAKNLIETNHPLINPHKEFIEKEIKKINKQRPVSLHDMKHLFGISMIDRNYIYEFYHYCPTKNN